MKILKGISLFFLYPMAAFGIGVWVGVQAEHAFYPGNGEMSAEVTKIGEVAETEEKVTSQVSTQEETLSADTEYVLREADVLHGTEVETLWMLPKQFVGMDREDFTAAVRNYSDYPPLSEQERGFVNAEVVSFARARVVVRKNYQQIRPDEVFYLAVKDNEIVVYLENRETIYMNTGILLETLPDDLQQQIMQMMRVEGEEGLYGFLENYSS